MEKGLSLDTLLTTGAHIALNNLQHDWGQMFLASHPVPSLSMLQLPPASERTCGLHVRVACDQEVQAKLCVPRMEKKSLCRPSQRLIARKCDKNA